MEKNSRLGTVRSRLLGSACATVIALSAGQALAQDATVTGNESFAIQQNQENPGSPIVLTLEGNSTGSVAISTGVVVGSTLSVGGALGLGNVSSSTSFGNESVQSIATNMNADNGSQAATGSVGASAFGPVVASSTSDVGFAVSQNYADTTTTASNTLNMGIATGAVTDSTLNVQRNTTEAIALLNRATTSLTANVNSTSATSGIALTQVADTAVLSSTTDATNSIIVDDVTGDDLTGSTASLTGNLQRSVGVGNLNATSQTLTGNDVTLRDGANPAATSGQSLASGGYATASSQSITTATMTAVTDGLGAGFIVSSVDDIIASTVANSSNTATSNLRGNESANAINLTANSIATENTGIVASGNVAQIASSQGLDASTLTARTMGVGAGVQTAVNNQVTDSTISSNANVIEASATGNQGANTLVASVTTLDTSGVVNGLSEAASGASATGAFAVSNAQSVTNSSITASLIDGLLVPLTGAAVTIDVGTDLARSTVVANGNTLRALATGNQITAAGNSITLTGTQIDTTTAVSNSQFVDGDVSAKIGVAGRDATADTTVAGPNIPGPTIPGPNIPGPTVTHNVTASVRTATYDFDLNQVITGDLYVRAAGLSADDLTVLAAQGYSLVTNYTASSITSDAYVKVGAAAGLAVPPSGGTSGISGQVAGPTVPGPNIPGPTIPGPDVVVLGTPATAGAGGVTVTIGDDIADSTVRVDGNMVEGAVNGNVATNRTTVSATDLGAAGNLTTATSGVVPSSGASADNAVSNLQEVADVELNTAVSAEFGIFTETGGLLSDVASSRLSVSGNTLMATTVANTGTNAVSLTATNLESSAAVLSVQISEADVLANSNMRVTAPAANTDSILQLNGNRNQSVATANTATNTVAIIATNVASISAGDAASLTVDYRGVSGTYDPSAMVATADSTLMNIQVSTTGLVTATATTSVRNLDGRDGTFVTDGIVNSTVEVLGNVTVAEASANRSANSMTLAGGASSNQTGAVQNLQENTVDVSAIAAAVIKTGVTGSSALAAASDSSITVGGNATLGQATGNRALNVLNASALGLTAAAAAGATGELNNGTGAMTVNASYGVLNLQGNAGDVTATVTATYGSDFTLAAGNNAVDQSRVSVMGNSVQGVASGNVASNLITLASLDSGAATSAIGSTQVNSGAIASNVTATMGINVASGTLGTGGDVGLSTLAMTGNTISSSAVGNSVTSSIVRN